MKIVQLFLVLLGTIHAFQQVQTVRRQQTTSLNMGFFDNPFHGSGSAGESDLDEIWEAQQAILRARKGETKEHMRAKYKDSNRKFEVKSSMDSKNQQHMNNVYVDETTKPKKKKAAGGFKMPWDK